MPYPSRRGGGGGTGGRQTFNAGTFVDLAALNAWGAANLGSLNNDADLVTIATAGSDVYEWTGEDTPASYPSGGSWTARSIAGPRGEPGPGISGVDAFEVVMTNADSTQFIPLGMRRMSNGTGDIQVDETVIFPQESIQVGDSSRTSSFGAILQQRSLITGNRIIHPVTFIDKANGATRTAEITTVATDTVNTQNDDSGTAPADSTITLPVTLTDPFGGEAITDIYFRMPAGGSVTGLRFRATVQGTSEPFYYFPTRADFEAGRGRDFADTGNDPNEIRLDIIGAPIVAFQNQNIVIDYETDTGQLAGNGTIPYLRADRNRFELKPVALQEDLVPVITSGTHTGLTAAAGAVVDGVPTVNLTVTSAPPPVTPQPRVTAFALTGVANTVDDGFVIPGNHVFTWSISNADQVQGMVTISRDGTSLLQASPTAGTATIPLTDRTLNFGDSVTYAISGTSVSGQSFSRMYTVRVPEQHQMAYWAIRPQDDFTTAALSELNAVDITANDEFDMTGAFAAGSTLGLRVPDAQDIDAILLFGTDVTSSFTRDDSTVSGAIFYTLTNSGGISGTANYRVRVRDA